MTNNVVISYAQIWTNFAIYLISMHYVDKNVGTDIAKE
jgi:hypothetical protein